MFPQHMAVYMTESHCQTGPWRSSRIPLVSEIFTAQLTAIANVVFAVFAVVTAFYARRAFRAQSDELTLQRHQFAQDQADRRRAQATRVFLWAVVEADPSVTQVQTAVTGRSPDQIVTAHVKNSSQQPVYEIEVIWRQGAALRGSGELRGVLMPGAAVEVKTTLPEAHSAAVKAQSIQPAVRFRDAAGVTWEMDSNGRLEEPSPEQQTSPASSSMRRVIDRLPAPQRFNHRSRQSGE